MGATIRLNLGAYRQAWSQPGALTAMVNWYRALRNFRAGGTDLRVRQKTLILWGDRDWFLAFGLAEASEERVGRLQLRFPCRA